MLLTSTDGVLWYTGGGPTGSTNPFFDIEALADGPIGIGQNGVTVNQRVSTLSTVSKSPVIPVVLSPSGTPLGLVTTYQTWGWEYRSVGRSARFRTLLRGAGALFATGEGGVVATAPSVNGPWVILRSNTTANLVGGTFRGNSLFIVGENETILESEPLYSSRLANLSTRGSIASGEGAMISGFVVSGTAPKRVLLRASGPALAAFGVGDAVAAPMLEVFDSERRSLASNRGWSSVGNAPELAATSNRVGAFPFAEGSADAALLLTLPPGAYTMQVSGIGSAIGTSLAEAYDADTPSNTGSRAINISTRGRVTSGSGRLIAGFVVSGVSSRRLLIRAIGPSLAAFGLSGTLAEPQIELYGSGNQLLKRAAAWTAEAAPDETRQAANITGAFALDDTRKDAAFVTELPPGSYTVQVSGLNGSTGLALVEVYDLP